MGFFSSLLTPSGPGINLASCPLGTGRKASGEWNLIVQLHQLRRLRMCGIRPLHLHCRWKKLYLGLWIVFLSMEPDILEGVKLLHTVIFCGEGGLYRVGPWLQTYFEWINLWHLHMFGVWRAFVCFSIDMIMLSVTSLLLHVVLA